MLKRIIYNTLLLVLFFLQANGNIYQPFVKKSLFAEGKWITIETSATGIHKIYFSWLKSIGFSHPENVKLFGSRNLAISTGNSVSDTNCPVQMPTMHFTETNGNEALLFYAEGPVTWKFDRVSGQYMHVLNQSARGKSWFYLTDDKGSDLKLTVDEQPVDNPDLKISDYDEVGLWEEENINLLESGSRWFTALMQGGNILKKTFLFPDRLEKEAITINAFAAGRSSLSTGMEISVNGNILGNLAFRPIQPDTDTDFASGDSILRSQVLAGNDMTVSFKYNGAPSDQCWFDYATLQFRRSLQYRGIPLLFRDSRSIANAKIVEFQINGANSGMQLWEVTNPLAPIQKTFLMNNSLISFKARSDSLRNYLLFDPAAPFPGVTKIEEIKNVDILGIDVPQYLILTPASFINQANRLAELHRNEDEMTVSVVTVESIFNELSGGYPDIAALRSFIRNLYWQKSGSDGSVLKYLLLFGKGTSDPVHEPNENNTNWIPAYQSANSLNQINSFVTDDYFGMMNWNENNQNAIIELGIGRIPAISTLEADIAVDKIAHYHDTRTLGDWRNNITFIGDDEDNNIHVADSEMLASMVNQRNPEYKTSKIYLDAYPQVLTPEERYPDVNEAIRRSVQTGDLIINYIGHASEDGLAHERVLTIQNIDSWSNKDRLPLFVTATCEFSRWDMTMKRSAGEHLLFHPAGGAIALLSATRLVYSASNFEINKSFFNHVFQKDNKGNPIRLGDLIRLVKNENSGSVNTLKFCLLGDPALHLNFPDYHCRNVSINHQPIDQFGGTLSPLSLVTIEGEIEDDLGKKMDQLGGTLATTVYDQPSGKLTLGNGGQPQFSYSVQENILFNGIVPVKNGVFTYSFVVPKDVNFDGEAGLIRYYFSNGTVDGSGSFSDVHFNGKESTPVLDNKGPDIQIYLENEKFMDGGTVSANPLLMVYLSDESGINTSGNKIGHDIIAELDGLASDPVILNDFYKSEQGTWKAGKIDYPLSTLSPGPHTLKFKVWDNAGNSSSVTVHFVVDNAFLISEIYNYPNPFHDQTRFVIFHNHYDELVDVNLEILDLTGKIIYGKHQMLASLGYEIKDLNWDPRESDPAQSFGMYIYRITVTSQDGNHFCRSGKLIWN